MTSTSDDERRRRRCRRPRQWRGCFCLPPLLVSLSVLFLCLLPSALSSVVAAETPSSSSSSSSSPPSSSPNPEISDLSRGSLVRARMSIADALFEAPSSSSSPSSSPSSSSSSLSPEQNQEQEQEYEEEQNPRQCFPYSATHSVAADSFLYPLVDADSGQPTGVSAQAERGELADLRCDSVVCPPPRVEDCYMRDGVCDEAKEYCLIEDHVKFGPAGAGRGGSTPLVAYLDCSFFAPETLSSEEGKKKKNNDNKSDNKYSWIWENVCGNRSDWGPWTTTRGRCVPYRKEQESCTGSVWRPASILSSSSLSSSSSSLLAPQYAASSVDGRPPARPLLCAPGLLCTGDAPPTPNTCVKARPRDVCYQGPWWDSSSPGACPRAELVRRWRASQRRKQKGKLSSSSSSSASAASTPSSPAPPSPPPPPQPQPPGGLPLPDLLAGAAAYLSNAPVEIYGSPLNPLYWSDPPLLRARQGAAAALEALWPRRYRRTTSFPLRLPHPRGTVHSAEWNATAALIHATSFRQIGRAWACVHTLVHNAPDPLPRRQAEASAALALWLRQHVTCCNCRGFFSQLLNEVGLPPMRSTSREEHARWWWRTHNAVSEHAAATRGGHPHLYPAMRDERFAEEFGARFGNKGALRCQNPWFLAWEDAVEMWRFNDDEGGGDDGGGLGLGLGLGLDDRKWGRREEL